VLKPVSFQNESFQTRLQHLFKNTFFTGMSYQSAKGAFAMFRHGGVNTRHGHRTKGFVLQVNLHYNRHVQRNF
jgi:hypothetical protein